MAGGPRSSSTNPTDRVEELHADVMLRETLVAVWREFAGRKGWAAPRLPSVAIVDLAGAATSTEFTLVRNDFESHGIPTVIATPEDLSYGDGELRAFGRRVDLVYKRLLVADFLARYDLRHPLAQAYADRNVCVASSFRCTIGQKKKALAAFFEPAYSSLFSAEQHAAITSLVAPTWPFGRVSRQRLDGDRLDLVLKPNDAHGGENVVLGWECDEARWRLTVANAGAGDFVVQQRAAAPHGVYPVFDAAHPEAGTQPARLIEDRNAYVFRGMLGGILTRLSSTGVINVAQGGQAIPTFVVYPL
jgi:hypothetical protein